jgi:DNA-binding NtrC family response regulator
MSGADMHDEQRTRTADQELQNPRRAHRHELALTIAHYPNPALIGMQVPLRDGLVIGRDPLDEKSAMALSEDQQASRVHAHVEKKGANEFVIFDAQSRNGVFVNGLKREKDALAEGDVVRVGETLLVVDTVLDVAPRDTHPLVGVSGAFWKMIDAADRVAPTKITTLLLGETGTGKELLARRIHEQSGHAGAFVAVNCAAIPGELAEAQLFGHRRGAFTGATDAANGFFREADKGTLFLDEIGELALPVQAKLLRVLESGGFHVVGDSKETAVDVRVVAATNADLKAAVAEQTFRTDLLARLSEFQIELPPLRERRADIALLFRHHWSEQTPSTPSSLRTMAIERLLLHDWPHNVRELIAVVRKLKLAPAGSDVSAFLPEPQVVENLLPEPQTQAELEAVLTRHAGNIRQVAAHYGRERRQIYRWIERFAIDVERFRQ